MPIGAPRQVRFLESSTPFGKHFCVVAYPAGLTVPVLTISPARKTLRHGLAASPVHRQALVSPPGRRCSSVTVHLSASANEEPFPHPGDRRRDVRCPCRCDRRVASKRCMGCVRDRPDSGGTCVGRIALCWSVSRRFQPLGKSMVALDNRGNLDLFVSARCCCRHQHRLWCVSQPE